MNIIRNGKVNIQIILITHIILFIIIFLKLSIKIIIYYRNKFVINL